MLNSPPRGATVSNSRALIQLFAGLNANEDYESVTDNWNQAAEAGIDGAVDAAVIPDLFPGARATDCAA